MSSDQEFEGSIPQFYHRYIGPPFFQPETVALRSHAASARDAALGLIQGTPLRNELADLAPDRIDELTSAVTALRASRYGSAPFDTPMQAHVFRALP